MRCEQLTEIWVERWPRQSELSNKQGAAMVRHFGVLFHGFELDEVTREAARAYGLKYPARVPFISRMYADALRDGLCETNPFKALGLKKPRRELVMPTHEELEMLVRAAEEPLKGRIAFAAYTGLRRGEVLALRPQDFEQRGGDADSSLRRDQIQVTGPGAGNGSRPPTSKKGACRVHVHRQINARGEIDKPKGKLKDRWGVVPEPARLAIAQHVVATGPEERLWPISPRYHDEQWRKLRRDTRLTHLRWHDLRHFAASWFLDHGASPEDVAVQLGQDDNGQLVRETYGHLDRDKALGRLEELLENPQTSSQRKLAREWHKRGDEVDDLREEITK